MQLSLESSLQAEGDLVTAYLDTLIHRPEELLAHESHPSPNEVCRMYRPLVLPNNISLMTMTLQGIREKAMTTMFALTKTGATFADPDLANFTVQQGVSDRHELSHRYVRPEVRENGYGSFLLQVCERHVAETRASMLIVSLGQHRLLKWLVKKGYESPQTETVLGKIEHGELVVGPDDYIYLPNTPMEEMTGFESDWVQRLTVSKRVMKKDLPA